LHEAHARQQEINSDSLIALQEKTNTAQTQLEIAGERLQSHSSELAILEKRFLRWQELVDGGHVSRDAFELEQANLIRARADHAELQQKHIDQSQVIQTLSRSQTEIRKQLDLNRVEHALSAERLQRSIELGRHEARQELSTLEQSVVAQILVRPGDAVRSGQVLAKLRRPGERLQAWLYLSTSSARLLRTGQSVEISLDAYPQQVYGTHTAIVSSVSGIALLPEDIRAPLLVAGPVFEVRAELNESSVSVNGVAWPLSPGISFSADIIQRRLKLYEWVFKSLLGDAYS
jgi:membrane fusion protein